MQNPRFPRIERSIHFTSEYFSMSRVAACISKLDGGLNLSYLDTFYEVTLNSHEEMEAEINQNIYGSNSNIQRELFEYLRDVLDNWWYFNDYKPEVEWLVDNYNEKTWLHYENEVIKEEEKFKLNVNYKIRHLEKYEKEYPAVYGIMGFMPKRKEWITNSWFFENLKKSEAINKDLLPDYFEMLDKIIASFKLACVKYVKRFFEGNIASAAEIVIQKKILPLPNDLKLLESAKDIKLQNTRIKVNISVEELTMLFRLLKEEKIILSKPRHDHEIHAFITHHFETIGMEDLKISVKNVGKLWSSTEPDVLTFWIKKFTDLIERARNK